MSEIDFQRYSQEMFARIGKLEQSVAALTAVVGERCSVRGLDISDHEQRLIKLEASEHRRKGARGVILAAAGVIGAMSGALIQVASWFFGKGGQ